jgi:DNA-binding MarR family transcriptional regulator
MALEMGYTQRVPRPRSRTGPDLADRFQRLMSLLMRTGAGDSLSMMQESGVSFAQMITLYMLHARGGQSVSSIAERTKLSLPTASQMIDRMVRGGLVSRTENPDDRRSRLVAMTPNGQKLLAELHGQRHRDLAATLGLLPPELADRFATVLGPVTEHLEKAMAERMSGEAPRSERRAKLAAIDRRRAQRA